MDDCISWCIVISLQSLLCLLLVGGTNDIDWLWWDTIQRRHAMVSYLCKGKGSPYSIAKRRVPELIPVLGSQPAGELSHKPSCRLPLLSTRPAVTLTTLKRAATSFAAWWTEARWVWTVCLRLLGIVAWVQIAAPTASGLQFEPRLFCAWVQHTNHSATKPTCYLYIIADNWVIYEWSAIIVLRVATNLNTRGCLWT